MTTTKANDTIRREAEAAAREAYEELPTTEPERSRFATDEYPVGHHANNMSALEDELGREPTEEEEALYEEHYMDTWRELIA